MKYTIRKVNLRHSDGQKDSIKGPILTNDIEAERSRLINKYNCQTVNFEFIEPKEFIYVEGRLHPATLDTIENPCEC